MIAAESLYRSPNALAHFYSRFRVGERLLLTGHSHQAWPDRGFEGQQQAWFDAAELLDHKWERAFAKAELGRQGFARLIDDVGGDIALGASTHELTVRFLSALPLRSRPRIVTTDGEFHSLRRQLDRLAEEGVQIERMPCSPAATVSERLCRAVDGRTAAVMVSSVFYRTGEIARGLGEVMQKCLALGAELLVDAYHALNVIPFSIQAERLQGAFVVGGGYKYCQLGEGNCFMRLPEGCKLRPVVTGWFSEFGVLETSVSGEVPYGTGAARFAGATYDPVSHYRAAEVFDFFRENDLTPEFLREVSRHQIRLLAEGFDALDAPPRIISRDRSIPLEDRAGFLVLRAPRADEICRELRRRGVETDFRGDALRLGPAPYLSDRQLFDSISALREVIRGRTAPS